MEEDKYLLKAAEVDWKDLTKVTKINLLKQMDALESMGITYNPGPRKLKVTPHLVNLTNDPLVTGTIIIMLEKVFPSKVGYFGSSLLVITFHLSRISAFELMRKTFACIAE